MPENVRALIVVLALALPAFYIGRRIAGAALADREFAVWRNAWFGITVAAFLTGSFFIFAAIVPIICLYARAVRAASAALFFVLLFAVPVVGVTVGGFGIVNALFDINNARLLSIVLLLPILFATSRRGRRNVGTYAMPDRLVFGYVLLMIALEFRNSDVTNILRVATLHTLDILIPYFVFSRGVSSVTDFRKVMLAFVIAVLPLALIAVFEAAKGWLLYTSITYDWAGPNMIAVYSQREGMLRALASAGSPIGLGFIIMVAIGCVLAVWQTTILSRKFAGIALAILAAGLVASLSRGPWVGATILVLAYVATGSNSVTNFGRFAVIGAVALALLLLTPAGAWLLHFLPFIGSVDAGSVDYRQRLFENAVQVIERNPWLGSADYLSTPEMQEMIQGQGIIDIVNTYLRVALNSGLVGLGLFLGFFTTILIGLRRVVKLNAVRDIGFSAYARASMATLIAILVTIGTVSSVEFIPYVYWSFAGLCVALVRIAFRERAAVTRAAHASPVTV